MRHKCKEILQALGRESQADGDSPPKRREVLIHWDPPPAGWMVLNTDGASKGNSGVAGDGGVLRGDKGEWICEFGESMGICTSMKAEFKAVLRGLRIGKSLGVTKLWVQVDSSTLARLLKGDFQCSVAHMLLLHQCQELINQVGWQVTISHCFREANKVADALANIGCNLQSGVAMYERPPNEVKELLFADCIGVGWPRRMIK